MEPFLIQCKSCRANLTVAKDSLIGKRLPCPNCQHPVLVVAPGSDVQSAIDSTTENPAADNVAGESDFADTHFDDVEQLLAKSAQPASTDRPQKRSHPKQRPQHETPQATPDMAAQPWANPAAQKMRKTIALVAAIIGSVLIVSVIAIAWMTQSSKSVDPATKSQPQANPETSVEADPEQLPKTNPPEDLQTPDPPPSLTMSNPETETTETTSPPNLAIVTTTPPMIEPLTPAVPDLKNLSPLGPTTSPQTTPLANDESNSGQTPNAPGTLRPVSRLQSNLGELASLLNQAGTSITDISDATASLGLAEAIGLPKYYVERPRPRDIDIARQLKLPCDGLRYQQTSLIDILRDISVITGVPISLDTEHLPRAAGGLRLIPKIDLNILNTDFAGAIDQCVQPLGWVKVVKKQGVLITRPDRDIYVAKTYDLKSIAGLGEEGLDGFCKTIGGLIEADSWTATPDQVSLNRIGTKLNVTHTSDVQQQIQSFLDKTIASTNLVNGIENELAKKTLRRRLQDAASAIAKPCDLSPALRGSLDDLLVRVRDKTDVDIIANWQTLAPAGWTPMTSVPGDVSEPTVCKAIQQLSRSMKITSLVLDSQTIELTTQADAQRRTYLEFYYVGELLKKQFIPQHIMQLIQEATAGSIFQSGNAMVYEPSCQSLIIRAPQATHQMIETVLARLE